MVMLKLPGCPWALSTVLMSCVPWEQGIHNWATSVDSNIDLIFQRGTYETWLQCRKKTIYCCYRSLVYHWTTEACKHFWILCQDNKIAINIALPTACMLETGKRAKLEIHNAFPGKETPHLERPTAHVPVVSSSLCQESSRQLHFLLLGRKWHCSGPPACLAERRSFRFLIQPLFKKILHFLRSWELLLNLDLLPAK